MAESKNIYGSIIPDELNNENVDADDWRVKLPLYAFVTTQQVFLRSSSSAKIAFLYDLFKIINRHPRMPKVLRLLDKYTTRKLVNYLRTLDYPEYVNDAHLKDHDGTLNGEELGEFFKSTLSWFNNLEDADFQLGFFLLLTSICGNNVIDNLMHRIKTWNAHHSKSKSLTGKPSIAFAAQPTIIDEYEAKLDLDDPEALLVHQRRKEWDDSLAKYRSKVERSIYGADFPKASAVRKGKTTLSQAEAISEDDVDKASGEKKKKTSKGSDKKRRLGNNRRREKTRSDKEVKAKDGRESKGQKKAGNSIDFIQLMPIWISINIFKYLDANTLKVIKSVNAYWDFVVSCTIQEENARKKMNSWIESIEEELNLKEFIPQVPLPAKPLRRFSRHAQPFACKPRLHEELKAQTVATAPQENESVLCKISSCKDTTAEDDIPLEIRPMERLVPLDSSDNGTKFIHRRAPYVLYDNNSTELRQLSEISLANYSIEELDNISSTVFEYWGSLLKIRVPTHSIESFKSDDLYLIAAKSFVNARKASKTAANSHSFNLKSAKLDMIRASLQHGMKSATAFYDNSENAEDSGNLLSTYKDYLVEEDMP